MGTITKPLLAVNVDNIDDIIYPILVTGKIDGIRCLVTDNGAVTRNFKPFPNNYIRGLVSKLPIGFDGEIIIKNKKFNEITHDVMSEDGTPDFTYCVFDYVKDDPNKWYDLRMEDLSKTKVPSFVEKILPILIKNKNELMAFEKKCLSDGYEGCMLRLPSGKYKFGRSTILEGFLLKIKRFAQDEAIVIYKCYHCNKIIRGTLNWDEDYYNKDEDLKDGHIHICSCVSAGVYSVYLQCPFCLTEINIKH